MDQYQDIRHLAAVEGLSQRAIARRLGISRNTVKRYFLGQNLPGERAKTESKLQVITPEVIEFVKRCLAQDKTANRKQRHTAKRIYDRLKHEKGFQGAESTLRRLVSQLRVKMPEVYIPLAFSPGEAAQVDWGTATVFIANQKTEVHLFCFRLCNSCAPFVMAFPVEREEAFLEAHQRAFEYFGGVSRTLIYDNLKTAVKEGWGNSPDSRTGSGHFVPTTPTRPGSATRARVTKRDWSRAWCPTSERMSWCRSPRSGAGTI